MCSRAVQGVSFWQPAHDSAANCGGIPAGITLSGQLDDTQPLCCSGLSKSAACSQGSAASLKVVIGITFTVAAGITLSKEQVRRGSQLAQERGLGNCSFQVMNALTMDFPDDSFDLVWACESGEHMPDKGKYIEEMVRVLKPGGCMLAQACSATDAGGVPSQISAATPRA